VLCRELRDGVVALVKIGARLGAFGCDGGLVRKRAVDRREVGFGAAHAFGQACSWSMSEGSLAMLAAWKWACSRARG